MDQLGIIIQKLKADALKYQTLRIAIVDYIKERGERLTEKNSETEYEYCESVGRLKEINEFTEFLINSGVFINEEPNETNETN
jgi:hypothetical protein